MRGQRKKGGSHEDESSSSDDMVVAPPSSSKMVPESHAWKTLTFFLCVVAIYASYISQGVLQEKLSVLDPLLLFKVVNFKLDWALQVVVAGVHVPVCMTGAHASLTTKKQNHSQRGETEIPQQAKLGSRAHHGHISCKLIFLSVACFVRTDQPRNMGKMDKDFSTSRSYTSRNAPYASFGRSPVRTKSICDQIHCFKKSWELLTSP